MFYTTPASVSNKLAFLEKVTYRRCPTGEETALGYCPTLWLFYSAYKLSNIKEVKRKVSHIESTYLLNSLVETQFVKADSHLSVWCVWTDSCL